MTTQPLAEKLRPSTLDDIFGQEHIIGNNQIIRRIIETKNPTSLILWGPPGSGKTTLARIIANQTESEFMELSAVTSGKADVSLVVKHAKQNQRLGQKTVLFVDEIHRFNKAQQDAFLPHVEDGTIVLIGATTENPSFEIINPLLSRSRVIILKPLSKSAIIEILKRAAKHEGISRKKLSLKTIELIADLSGGDARIALGNLELAAALARNKTINKEIVLSATQKQLPKYDKNGENHFNIVSAFIKSMRGGDTEATSYWLARMIQAGEDPKYIARRMIIFASEDIGLAGNGALSLAVATFDAIEKIGLPEAKYNLFHCATALAKSKKSREITKIMQDAERLAGLYPNSEVPTHLRNAPNKFMKNIGYGKDYKWQKGYKHPKGFMPEEINKPK